MNKFLKNFFLAYIILAALLPVAARAQDASGAANAAKLQTWEDVLQQSEKTSDVNLRQQLQIKSACYLTGVCNDATPWAAIPDTQEGRINYDRRLTDISRRLNSPDSGATGSKYDGMKQAIYDQQKGLRARMTDEDKAKSQNLSANDASKDSLVENNAEIDKDVPNICGYTEVTCGVVRAMVVFFHNIIIPLFAKILKLVNLLFNQVFKFSVREFSTYGKSAAVQFGWTLSRDLVNLSLIFILLYAAIRLILNIGGGSKRLVGGVIVVAILVNFSAFLTGIVIDASNIVADQFYSAAGGGGSNKQSPASQEDDVAPDIAAQLIKKTLTGVGNSKLLDQVKAGKTDWMHVFGTIFIQDVMKIPFFLITIVVLGAAALMFFVRMLTLMFLLMLSPLAFLAYVLSKKYWDKWFSALTSNAIFAPAFFFMFSITILTVSKGPLANIGGTDGSTDFGFVSNLIYVIIVNGMMIASLLIAKNFGAYGASGALGLLNRGRKTVQGFAGRNTFGRVAKIAADSDWMKRQEARSPLVGGYARSTIDSVAKYGFGAKQGFRQRTDDYAKRAKDLKDPVLQARYISSLNSTMQKEIFSKMSADDRLKLINAVVPEKQYEKEEKSFTEAQTKLTAAQAEFTTRQQQYERTREAANTPDEKAKAAKFLEEAEQKFGVVERDFNNKKSVLDEKKRKAREFTELNNEVKAWEEKYLNEAEKGKMADARKKKDKNAKDKRELETVNSQLERLYARERAGEKLDDKDLRRIDKLEIRKENIESRLETGEKLDNLEGQINKPKDDNKPDDKPAEGDKK